MEAAVKSGAIVAAESGERNPPALRRFNSEGRGCRNRRKHGNAGAGAFLNDLEGDATANGEDIRKWEQVVLE